MNITIVGIGNAGTAVGADLTRKGHDVTFLKTSNKLHNDNYEFIKKNRKIYVDDLDKKYEVNIRNVTENYKEAISNAEVIIIFVQTNYHCDVIEKMIEYLTDGQTIIIEPGYLSSCYFINKTHADITIIEAESSPIDCRVTSPGHVKVLFKNVCNPFGVFPCSHHLLARDVLDALDFPYMITKNVIEAALHNPNLIVHTIGAIFSIPRIEKTHGEYWMYKEVFTPHIWNLVTELDKEKMSILKKLGCQEIPYVEACKKRNSLDENEDAMEVFFEYANNSSPKGPSVPDSRYITEDVSQGLVLLESLGQVMDIETPVTTGLINCASALIQTDFRKTGRTINKLERKNIDLILEDYDNYIIHKM